MKKILKIILIVEMIILSVFFIGYFIFEQNYISEEDYGICPNTTLNYGINESLLN